MSAVYFMSKEDLDDRHELMPLRAEGQHVSTRAYEMLEEFLESLRAAQCNGYAKQLGEGRRFYVCNNIICDC
jgi:hypothetical protein